MKIIILKSIDGLKKLPPKMVTNGLFRPSTHLIDKPRKFSSRPADRRIHSPVVRTLLQREGYFQFPLLWLHNGSNLSHTHTK